MQFHLDWVFDLREYQWMIGRYRSMWLSELYLYFLKDRNILYFFDFIQRGCNAYLLFTFSFDPRFQQLGCFVLFLVQKLLKDNNEFKLRRPATLIDFLIYSR